jgi:propionate CoA-transferase
VEVAPGIDLERQVLTLMGFRPILREPRVMPEYLFSSGGGE